MTPKDEELLREFVASVRCAQYADREDRPKAWARIRRALDNLELKSTLPKSITGADFP